MDATSSCGSSQRQACQRHPRDRDLRKQAGTFRHYAEQCLADANTVHTAIGELDKYPVLLATANDVPDQLDKALAVARAINAAAAQQWE